MKHHFACCAALLLALGLVGCGSSAPETIPTTIPVETTAATTLPPETEPPETTMPEGTLFLTVSQLHFSLVGDSEDIYAGTAPRDYVTWESDDEAVAAFHDGILTATGVGETTVRAIFDGEVLECAVSCLAESQEALEALDEDVLRSPKRYPPEVDPSVNSFFADSAIVGDSISYILFQYETKHELLGHPLFLARGGTSLNGFVRRYKNIYYQGREQNLEDAISHSGVKKVFIMLGQNDLGYRTIEQTFESWDTLLERIWEKSPDVEIYLQSCVDQWADSTKDFAKNEKIRQYNEDLKAYAQEKGCYFVDIAPYVEDHIHSMASIYSMDHGIHLNEDGCIVWMQALNAYAYQQLLGGSEQ